MNSTLQSIPLLSSPLHPLRGSHHLDSFSCPSLRLPILPPRLPILPPLLHSHLPLLALLMIPLFPPSSLSNPPFSPTPQSRFNMFNCLPPELIRQIIESAIPSTSLPSNYAERQANLKNFCFICRYVRSVAQPLLFAIVSAKNSPRTLNEALIAVQSKAAHSSKGWTRYIREVSIECSGSLSPITSRFERLARNGQGLRVLTLAYLEETVNLALLTQLPRQSFRICCSRMVLSDTAASVNAELRDLRLFGKSFKINSRFVLPRLESLTMDHDSLDTLLPRLRPASLPALRNLAVPYSNRVRPARLSELLKNKAFRPLLDQVDTLFVDSYVIESCALNDFQPFFRKTLVSVDRYDIALTSQITLRLQHVRFRNFIHFVGFASYIYNNEINPINLPLRSLYLDAVDRHKTIRLIQRGVVKKHSVNELFSGVDVIYEERGGDSPFNSIISEDFVARQRRRNAGEDSGW